MLAKISVKKPYTVIVGIILVIALGVISFMNMTTDLLPSMDLPYVIVYTSYTGATPERVEEGVTRPLEAAFATLTDVKNVSSTSSENLSLVVMEFEAAANMDTAMIEISSEIDQLSGSWEDAIGTPVIMKLNPNMLPVMVSTVSLEDADLYELSDYVEDELIPEYEAVDGVASVSASGILTQQVDITIEQSRIDALNSAILAEVDEELAEVEAELLDAQSKLRSGKSQLARLKESTFAQIDEGLAAIEQGSLQMPMAIEQLTAQRSELQLQLDGAKAALAQMDSLTKLTEEEKAQLKQTAEALAALEAQRAGLQAQLEALGSAPSGALTEQLAAAQKSKEEQLTLKASQQKYIEDLKLLDADSLNETIARLEGEIAANEAELSDVRGRLENAIVNRDAALRTMAHLSERITALEAVLATPVPTAEPTPEPTHEITLAPTMAATAEATVEATVEATAQATVEAATAEPTMEAAADATLAPAENTSEATAAAKETSLLDKLLGVANAEGESLEELRAQLAEVQAQLDAHQADVDVLSLRHDSLRETLNQQAKALEEAKDALAILEDGEITVQSRIEAAEKQIAACDERIAGLDAEIAEITARLENSDAHDALAAQIAQLDARISEIRESDAYRAYQMIQNGDAFNAQYAQAQAAVAQLEAGIASIDTMLDKLNRGILPGGLIEGMPEDTDLNAAREQLLAAREEAKNGFSKASSALRDAEEELAEGMNEFYENRDKALEEAGIDGIITVQTVSGILGSQNLDMPAGYVANAEDRYLVSVGNEFASLAELKQLKLFSLGLESVDDVRLLDVASVEISDNSADLFTLVNGENGIMISFEKQSTASTAEVAANITAESERLMAENPKLQVVEMMNQGDYINLIIDSVLENLISGGALAILILLLFLMDWRPTLIVAFSIPVSVVIAFVCMYFAGISLNVMSLSGLALAVGMLVDNSIVAIENIYRLRSEEHLPLLTACIRGVNQLGGALLSSTLTTICVFLPVVFVEGMARDLFSDMGLTIAFSLLASLVVAMTIVPSFAATLFKKSKPKKQRIFGAFQRAYTVLLRGALKVKPLVLLAAIALLAFSVYQIRDMGISLMPSVNSTQMSASLAFEDAEIPESKREAVALEIMERIMDVDSVTDVSLSGSSGMSMMSMGGGSGEYSYYLLVEEGVRKNADIANDIRAAAAEFTAGGSAVLTVQESTMDLSAMAGSGITINIRGQEIDALRTAAKEVAALCAQVEGAENIDDGSDRAEPKLQVSVDKELASDNSLSVAQVYQYIAQRLYGAVELTNATLDGREYTIYVSEDKNANLSPEDIADMEIEVTSAGSTKQVRIGDIARITEGESLASISRSNGTRTVAVSFAVAEGYNANHVSADLEALLDNYTPPAGCKISLSGENESVMGYMEDLITMLLIAVLFIFLIMVAQFQSFKSPIIVMFTIPLAFTGGLLALILTGMDLSIIAMVGFLVLSGVVVNNGIVFIDSINQMRIAGMAKKEAIVETGRIRLRPVLMTALTTILGMSTMALAQGMGAEMMQPMAIVTIGGLSYATLMTLFVVPVLYDIFNGEKMKLREIEMMKEAAGMKREGFDDGEAAAEPVETAAAPASVQAEAKKTAKPDFSYNPEASAKRRGIRVKL